jgi:hypothetical protein
MVEGKLDFSTRDMEFCILIISLGFSRLILKKKELFLLVNEVYT